MAVGRQNSESINFENTILNTTGDMMLDERRRTTVVLQADIMNITLEDKKDEPGPPKLDMTLMDSQDGGIGAIREVSEHSGSQMADSASLGDKGLDQTVKK